MRRTPCLSRRHAFTAFSLVLVTSLVIACGRDSALPTAPRGGALPGSPIFAVGVDPVTGARIETSQDDYNPGELVHITLVGWKQGEDVRLVMSESPETHVDLDTTVTADIDGEWAGAIYDVKDHDFGVTFTLTATGTESGSVATVQFTDGAVLSIVGTAPSPPTAGNAFDVIVQVVLSGDTPNDWRETRIRLTRTSPAYGSNPIYEECFNTNDYENTGTRRDTVTIPASGGGWDGGQTLQPGTYTLGVRGYTTNDDCDSDNDFPSSSDVETSFTVLPPAGPVLDITKLANTDSDCDSGSGDPDFCIGSDATYTLTVENDGADPTSGTVTVTDTLPASSSSPSYKLNYISGTGAGWACGSVTIAGPPARDVVTCTTNDVIAAGGSKVLTLTVNTTAAGTRSDIVNRAWASGGGDASADSDTDQIDLRPPPALEILSIVITPDPSTPGSARSAAITVRVNSGSWECYDWRIRDETNNALPNVSPFNVPPYNSSVDVDNPDHGVGTHVETLNFTSPVPLDVYALRIRVYENEDDGDCEDLGDEAFQTFTVSGAATAPDVAINKSHTGSFNAGGTGTYTLQVSNAGNAATSGTVTVVETPPAGLTVSAISGTGWTCVLGTLTCTRSDALAAAASYPNITVSVNVAANAAASVTNSASVSGGGETNTANNTASDPTTVISTPDITINKSHIGNFNAGGTGSYTLQVSNVGTAATSGTVTVVETPPAGLTVSAISGTGWTCVLGTLTCTRSDALAAAASYPNITVSVNVAANAAASVTNEASASGGGETNTANNTDTDPTTIVFTPDLTINKSHVGSFNGGGTGSYTLAVTNSGTGPTSGTVTVVETPPAGLTVTAISGTGWTCVLGTLTCTRSDALAAAASYPNITVSVDVAADPGPSVTNSASVSGGGETNTANNTDTDPTTIDRPPVLGAISNILNHPEQTLASFTASATDADGDVVGYTLAACAAGTYPTGAAIGAASGAFTWTPGENQGAASYCVKVVATSSGGVDDQEVTIGVTEVNRAPDITVPADFSIKWGVALSSVNASAIDPDSSAPPPGTVLNNLAMSLKTFPTGMTINTASGTSQITRAISWTPGIGQLGANSVVVRVLDDGTPVMGDSAGFTITVLSHATTLTYDGATSGQYSDLSLLCATLTDDDASNAAIPGKTITFKWDGVSVGTGTTNSSGRACTDSASGVYKVLNPNGNHIVKAEWAGGGGYSADDTGDITFDVDAEDATVTPHANNQNAYQVAAPGGTASFQLIFLARETYSPEPDPNDKPFPGNIANAALAANVSLSPVQGGSAVNATTCTPSGTGTTYGSARTFTCAFTNVPVETYEVIANLDGTYYRGGYSDVLTVFDPSLGFVTGGGKYQVQNADLSFDYVNFGFVGKVVQNKKTSVIKGSLLVIRHKSNGDVARIKSNVFDGLAIGTNANAGSATFSGKANYSVNGVTDPTNYDFTAYVFDGGTPGAGVDKFSLYHGKGNAAAGYEIRTSPTLAALKNVSNVKTLTNGNIQVPQPQGR